MNDSWGKQLIIELDLEHPKIAKYKYAYQYGHIYHKLNGPAIIYTSGDKYWHNDGKLYNMNGSTIIDSNEYMTFWVNHF